MTVRLVDDAVAVEQRRYDAVGIDLEVLGGLLSRASSGRAAVETSMVLKYSPARR